MPNKGQLNGEFVKCEWCEELIYKTPSQLKKYKHHYCSNKCQSLKRHAETYEDRPCEICGNLMHVSKKSTQRFCSTECQKIWQTQQVGELNTRFTQEKVKCDCCGQEFLIKQYKLNNNNHFCSVKCRQDWYANVWSQSEEWRNESRIRAAELVKKNWSTIITRPQTIINNLLDRHNIKYKNEEVFVYYSVDNYLIDCNLIVEVMGDYWHGNPLKFDMLNDMQKNNIRRDKAKNTFIKKYNGINILYLWEKDIMEHLELCELLIQLYIQNNGVLENYHSFNYVVRDNKLQLSSCTIEPYQDMDYNNIKENTKQAV